MKNKLLAVMAIFGMVASASAVKVNNNLSINGFIDGSYQLVDADSAANDRQSLDLDEVELNFNYSNGSVSGIVSIDSAAGANDLDLEQASITYQLNDSVSFTFGKYGSALGFEREDPAGLYTFSRAYEDAAFNSGNIDQAGNVVNGLTVAYSADVFTIAASLEEADGANLEAEDLNLELAFTYTGFSGINIGGGYFFDNAQVASNEIDELNLHVSRQLGKLLLAGEYTQLKQDAGDRDAYLILADYDVNDKLGVAVRLSNAENTGGAADYEKFTIAPNYAITDSLGAILEWSDVEGGANGKAEEYAVELTYTF
jgi:hypothetical protein